MEKFSRFVVTPNESKTRNASNVAELTLTTVKGKIKLNAQASLMLNVKQGDRLWFLSNYDAMRAAAARGELEATDNPIVFRDQDGEEIEATFFVAKGINDKTGSKLLNVNKITAVGTNLECSDSYNYSLLGGNDKYNVVYKITSDTITEEIDGVEVKMFRIEPIGQKEKISKKK